MVVMGVLWIATIDITVDHFSVLSERQTDVIIKMRYDKLGTDVTRACVGFKLIKEGERESLINGYSLFWIELEHLGDEGYDFLIGLFEVLLVGFAVDRELVDQVLSGLALESVYVLGGWDSCKLEDFLELAEG
jgi:hypothetical protein